MRGICGASDEDSASDSTWDVGGGSVVNEVPSVEVVRKTSETAKSIPGSGGEGERRASCDFCSRRKRKCNGNQPCQNCCKLKLVCHFSIKQKSGRKRKPRPEDSVVQAQGANIPLAGQGQGGGVKNSKRKSVDNSIPISQIQRTQKGHENAGPTRAEGRSDESYSGSDDGGIGG
ncbi:unnamed protein product, partial [Choristocarpus tenellus]